MLEEDEYRDAGNQDDARHNVGGGIYSDKLSDPLAEPQWSGKPTRTRPWPQPPNSRSQLFMAIFSHPINHLQNPRRSPNSPTPYSNYINVGCAPAGPQPLKRGERIPGATPRNVSRLDLTPLWYSGRCRCALQRSLVVLGYGNDTGAPLRLLVLSHLLPVRRGANPPPVLPSVPSRELRKSTGPKTAARKPWCCPPKYLDAYNGFTQRFDDDLAARSRRNSPRAILSR